MDITTFAQIAQHGQRGWVKMELPEGPELDITDDLLNRFTKSICEFVFKSEMRGNHGLCNHFTQSEQDYFVVYMNDHVLNKTQWLGGNVFEPGFSHDAFEVDFIYNRAEKEIQVRCDGDVKKSEALCQIWAREVLGISNLKKREKDAYDIQRLKYAENANFRLDPRGWIQSANVISLTTFLDGNKRRKRTYDEPSSIYELIEDEVSASAHSLNSVGVSKVKIALTYQDSANKTRKCTLNISCDSCNDKSLPTELQPHVRKFLVAQEILNDNDAY